MTSDRPAALKIANEVMDTMTINPHAKASAWPLDMFVPLARDYLRMVARDHADTLYSMRESGPTNG